MRGWVSDGFDSSRVLILRGGNSHVHKLDRGSPGKFDSRTLNRETLSRGIGHRCPTSLEGTVALPRQFRG